MGKLEAVAMAILGLPTILCKLHCSCLFLG
jgi:hypothetical protein